MQALSGLSRVSAVAQAGEENPMKKALLLTLILMLVTVPIAMWGDTMVCIKSRAGNEIVNWSPQLGPPGTKVVSPFNATTFGSLVQMVGNFMPGTTGSVAIEGIGSFPAFTGDFFPGDLLLLSAFPKAPPNDSLQLQFKEMRGCSQIGVGVSQVGAQINPDNPFPRVATVTAYDSTLTVLGSCQIPVKNNGTQNGSAPYLGIEDQTAPNIYYVQFDVHDGFAINELSLTIPVTSCVQPPNTTMVAWYPFDEKAGTGTSADLAMANVGTWNNLPTPVCGVVGNGLSFNGTNQYVESPSTIVTNFGPGVLPTACAGPGYSGNGGYSTCVGDFSIDTWIQIPPGAPSNAMVIVDKRTGSPPNIQGYSFFLENGSLGLQLADAQAPNGFTDYYSPSLKGFIDDGNWHHVAVTVQARFPGFYFDGSPRVTTCSIFNCASINGSLVNNSPLRIGGPTTVAFPTGYFQGNLDELEIYNRALTSAEVLGIYNAGSLGKCKPQP